MSAKTAQKGREYQALKRDKAREYLASSRRENVPAPVKELIGFCAGL
jgi:hypothetical protein